jgi:hypothetical protein
MKCLTLVDQVMSIRVTGKLGKSQYYGNSFFGESKFGSAFMFSGVYQKRYVKKLKKKGYQTVKMVHAVITNPRTDKQQDNRQKLANAHAFYKILINQGFSEAIKSLQTKEITGYNRFIQLFLTKKPSYFGLGMYGFSNYGENLLL